jgi:soluble cytochrome b562
MYDEKFILDFGKRYGYNFEYEANYNKICLVNKAVYIARYSDDIDINGENAGKWTATGAQFQHPYVFKKLFSKEPIEFNDMCETKNVSTALYLDMNEDLPDVSEYESELEKLQRQLKDPRSKLNKAGDIEAAKARIEELKELIKPGHNYVFVGRTGSFCPMKDGSGGGVLVRENKDKFDSAPNSSGTRWMEAEMVKTLGKEKDINTDYFDKLCDAAIDDISKYGDFYWFQSEERYVSPPPNPLDEWVNINSDELPF